jgi:3D (Asp-Asp-Asp) domain-containing protein
LIGRGALRVSHALAIGMLTAGLVGASFGAHPAAALAQQIQATASPVGTASPEASPLPSATPLPSPSPTTWIKDEKHVLPLRTIHEYDLEMAPGTSRIISPGVKGERDVIVRYTRRDDGSVQRWVVASHVTRAPRPRVVARGAGAQELAEFEARGVTRMASIAESAMQMVATAYTANCAGCGGITALGRPAGHGIVAVDPRVIPLGARLFIPGYGAAIAGDTGGAIHGLRIDLGFNSLREALDFGRREVTVYRLK